MGLPRLRGGAIVGPVNMQVVRAILLLAALIAAVAHAGAVRQQRFHLTGAT